MSCHFPESATLYSSYGIEGTGILVFRDLPRFIKQYSPGIKALDYGCGIGRSTRFLKNLGLKIEGVDVNPEMIKKAQRMNDGIKYRLINSANIPHKANTFDIVSSILVLFDVSTQEELLRIFSEIHRVLVPGGIFLIVTGSTEMYSYPWLSLEINYPENAALVSGDIAKIKLKDINLELYDYYWTTEDYKKIIAASNFSLLEQFYPLGSVEDGYPWLSETRVSPYVVYVVQKS